MFRNLVQCRSELYVECIVCKTQLSMPGEFYERNVHSILRLAKQAGWKNAMIRGGYEDKELIYKYDDMGCIYFVLCPDHRNHPDFQDQFDPDKLW